MNNTAVFDKDINPVLEIAVNEDLETLVEYVSEKLSENLTTHEAYKEYEPNHTKYADLIAKEIRDMGGNSFANVWRGEGPSYHEIVCDVASKLKAPYNKDKNIENIENSILETILKEAIEHMSEDEKIELLKEMGGKGGVSKGGIATATFIGIFRAGGFYSYQLTLIIANQIALAILGRGLMLATNAGIVRAASTLAGPIGWAITGIWTAVDLAGPAYKITIPCVIHIAMLRKKLNSLNCNNCDAILPDTTMKFCPECGEAISG
jgi:uncharacterized protein YaaW (UPF0174 family)